MQNTKFLYYILFFYFLFIFKSKVIRCSRYVNVGRMGVKLNGKPLEEVNCFKYL